MKCSTCIAIKAFCLKVPKIALDRPEISDVTCGTCGSIERALVSEIISTVLSICAQSKISGQRIL